MALEIVKNSEYGVDAKYWKIVNTNIDWLNKKANIVVWGFKDKIARDNQNSPLTQSNYAYEQVLEIGGTIKIAFPFTAEDNIVSKSYELIKEMPEFKGAKDV